MIRLRGHRRAAHLVVTLFILAFLFHQTALPAAAQTDNPNPPDTPVKLVFIHHSTGENWLRDGDGGLGLALAQNNYFVSDTNYGWGPDAIGDRTDIINWPEWFLGPESPRYMEALFAESEQHSEYTRLFGDPGGENQIILFKSCFPNSALEGNPDDPAVQSDSLSVGGAKYIYNQLLTYFATRPDKLFVVITAPPLSDRTYAENARAFNNWLVQDWLVENNYPYQNVVVFDFYNVLTDRDNHHRFTNGQVEYINDQGKDTSAYASGGGDDHPNQQGNQKAAEEFIPLLNVFYHRWIDSLPASTAEQQPDPTSASASSPSTSSSVSFPIDDFETGTPAGTNGWEPNWDASTSTQISCAPGTARAHGGSNSLQIDFDIAAESWGTCTLFYDPAQDWTSGSGLSFYYSNSRADLVFDVDLYAGSMDAMETYHFTLTPAPESVDSWKEAHIPWSEFIRVDWEENAGAAFDGQGRVIAVGFGLTGSGSLWIDDLQVSGGEPPAALEPAAPPAVADTKETEVVEDIQDAGPAESAESQGAGGICPFALAPAGLVITAAIIKRKKTSG